MTFGIVIDVAAPIEFYDKAHAEITRRITGKVEGLICHVGRATPTGVQILEIWESKEQYEQYAQEKIGPYTQQVGIPGPPRITFYDVHNYQVASVLTK